eukprot:Awhi_evm1s3009
MKKSKSQYGQFENDEEVESLTGQPRMKAKKSSQGSLSVPGEASSTQNKMKKSKSMGKMKVESDNSIYNKNSEKNDTGVTAPAALRKDPSSTNFSSDNNGMKRSPSGLTKLKKSISSTMIHRLEKVESKLSCDRFPHPLYLVRWLGSEKVAAGDATDIAVKHAIETTLKKNKELEEGTNTDKNFDKNDLENRKQEEGGRTTWAGGEDRFWLTTDEKGIMTWKEEKDQTFVKAPRLFGLETVVYVAKDTMNPKIIAFITRKPGPAPHSYFVFLWKAMSEDDAQNVFIAMKHQKDEYDVRHGNSNNLPSIRG